MTRHPSTANLLRWFDSEHLPEHLRVVVRPIHTLALDTAVALPDSPELTAGLRKLLEAKDCFVRATIAAQDDEIPSWTDR